MSESLKYQCVILVGGATFSCVESYESVHARLREAAFKFGEGDTDGDIRYAEPLELTIGVRFEGSDEASFVRAAFSPVAISAVYELPADLANEAP